MWLGVMECCGQYGNVWVSVECQGQCGMSGSVWNVRVSGECRDHWGILGSVGIFGVIVGIFGGRCVDCSL